MITSPEAAADYPHLLSPFALGNVELRNRFVFQPHFTALMGDDSMPNAILHDYFLERARGGAGLIVDGHMTIMVEGMMAPHYIKAWEEGWIPAYRAIVDDVHAQGARIIGQVTHAGHTSLTEPPPILWAPTQMPEPSSHHTTRAMDLDDIARAVRGFGDALPVLPRLGGRPQCAGQCGSPAGRVARGPGARVTRHVEPGSCQIREIASALVLPGVDRVAVVPEAVGVLEQGQRAEAPFGVAGERCPPESGEAAEDPPGD